MLCTLCYCVIIYMVSKQPLEFFRFGLFLLMCIALTMLTQAIGVLIGSSLTITVSLSIKQGISGKTLAHIKFSDLTNKIVI